MPDDTAVRPTADPSARPDWQTADVKRAVEAAEQAGLSHYRVEIAPDGTISIVVGDPSASA